MIESELKELICNRIDYLRRQQGLNIEALAYQSGLSKGGLSEILNHKKSPQILTVAKICSTLGIYLEDFFNTPELKDFVDKI